jgi:F-type H+-transporting ATPase subunit b
MVHEASQGVLGTLGISWKLFLAQLINFAIVIAVMWKWVYKPLLKMMDARAKEIAQGLKDARDAKLRLAEGDAEKEKLIRDARGEGQRLIEEAQSRSEALRQEKLDQTKAEIEKIVLETKERINQEKEATYAALQNDIADLIARATEKVSLKFDESQQRALISEALSELKKAKAD